MSRPEGKEKYHTWFKNIKKWTNNMRDNQQIVHGKTIHDARVLGEMETLVLEVEDLKNPPFHIEMSLADFTETALLSIYVACAAVEKDNKLYDFLWQQLKDELEILKTQSDQLEMYDEDKGEFLEFVDAMRNSFSILKPTDKFYLREDKRFDVNLWLLQTGDGPSKGMIYE